MRLRRRRRIIGATTPMASPSRDASTRQLCIPLRIRSSSSLLPTKFRRRRAAGEVTAAKQHSPATHSPEGRTRDAPRLDPTLAAVDASSNRSNANVDYPPSASSFLATTNRSSEAPLNSTSLRGQQAAHRLPLSLCDAGLVLIGSIYAAPICGSEQAGQLGRRRVLSRRGGDGDMVLRGGSQSATPRRRGPARRRPHPREGALAQLHEATQCCETARRIESHFQLCSSSSCHSQRLPRCRRGLPQHRSRKGSTCAWAISMARIGWERRRARSPSQIATTLWPCSTPSYCSDCYEER